MNFFYSNIDKALLSSLLDKNFSLVDTNESFEACFEKMKSETEALKFGFIIDLDNIDPKTLDAFIDCFLESCNKYFYQYLFICFFASRARKLLLKFMDDMKGKSIYFSYQFARGIKVSSPKFKKKIDKIANDLSTEKIRVLLPPITSILKI